MNLASIVKRLKESEFAQHVGETYSTRMLVMAIGLLSTIWVSRLLGPAGRGDFVIAATLAALGIQFSQLGFSSGNVYFVSKNPQQLPTYVNISLLLSLIIFVLCLTVYSISFAVKLPIPLGPKITAYIALWIPVGVLYLLLQNVLLGLKAIHYYNGLELTVKFLTFLLISLFFVLQRVVVPTVLFAYLLPIGVGVLLMLVKVRKHGWNSWTLHLNDVVETLKYGSKVYTGALFSFLLMKVDLLVVKGMLGSKMVGLYSASTSLSDLIMTLPVAINTILFAKLSRLQDRHQQWNLTLKATFITALLIAPICLICAVFPYPFVRILFGRDFVEGCFAVKYLMPGTLFLGSASVMGVAMGAGGFPKYAVLPALVAFLTNLMLCWELTQRWGIAGAAISNSLSMAVLLGAVFLLSQFAFLKKPVSQ